LICQSINHVRRVQFSIYLDGQAFPAELVDNVQRSKCLPVIGAAMPFFTLLTPASVFLRAKIALLEHEAMTGLLRAGKKLAMGQNNRLLTPNEIEKFQEAISITLVPSLLFSALCLMTVLIIFKNTRAFTVVAATIMIVAIIPLFLLDYQVSVPFLILGALALFSSLSIQTIFERAKTLNVA